MKRGENLFIEGARFLIKTGWPTEYFGFDRCRSYRDFGRLLMMENAVSSGDRGMLDEITHEWSVLLWTRQGR